MSNEELFEAIGDVDDKFVLEARATKKKKRLRIWIAVAACLILLCGIYAMADGGAMEKWGKYLAGKNQVDENKRVYAKGKTATVYQEDVDQAIAFYLISAVTEEAARQQAVKYVMEQEALYQEALRQGYNVSEKEIDDYLSQLREMVKLTDNSEEIASMIGQFESEDAYWEYEKTVYHKSLPIQKMNSDIQKRYFEEHPDATAEQFSKWFADWKQELVEAERFEVQ